MKNFETFESNRWIWRINLALQAVLVAALVAIVNYIGMHAYSRIDLTEWRAFSLSPETLGNIAGLQEPVSIVVTLTDNTEDAGLAQAYRDVRGILREYEFAARSNPRGRITVRFLDVYEQLAEAERLGVKTPSAIVFRRGGPGQAGDPRERMVLTDELYRTRNRVRSEFTGEEAFTAALLHVATGRRDVLYFLTGHGEMRLDNVDPLRGASQLGNELAARGYEAHALDLAGTRRVPEDASAVVAVSPQTPILRSEREILRDYLAKGTGAAAGRLLLCLDPGRQHGLDELLLDWGLLADDVLVFEADPAAKFAGGDILVRKFAPHPITQVFIDNQQTVLMGQVRSVRADPGRPPDPGLEVTELLASSDASWGDFGYRSAETRAFDPARDLRGPVRIAALSERKVDRLGVNIQGGRVVVFGNSDFLANHRIGDAGNKTLFLNAASWAIDRKTRLDIPTRPVRRMQLTLSQEQLVLARLAVLLGPALFVAAFGFATFLARRR
jgi:ABC-type uncharacterized transport system involved in gliding motility auxiliary subunit